MTLTLVRVGYWRRCRWRRRWRYDTSVMHEVTVAALRQWDVPPSYQALILIKKTQCLIWKNSWDRFCVALDGHKINNRLPSWNLLQWVFALETQQRHGAVVALLQGDKICCRFPFQFTFLSEQVHLVRLWRHHCSSLRCFCPLCTEVLFITSLTDEINLTSFICSYCQPVPQPSVCFRAHWWLKLNLTGRVVGINILRVIAMTFSVI